MDGNFAKGFSIAVLFSVPLWLSIYGWVKIVTAIYSHGLF